MANNEMKTNAEIYREQRKERLAKAAKKKSHGKRDKIVGTIVKVVCILVAVSVVLVGALSMLTSGYHVVQKFVNAATYGESSLTFAEYNYYYMSLYNQAYSISQQYDSQYSGYGATYFNTTKSPAEQDYPGDDAPEGVKTWADYFEYMAVERGFLMQKLYEDSLKDKNFKLTDDQKKELDEAIAEVKNRIDEEAKKNDVSVNVFVSKSYGNGLDLEKYIELIEKDQIAQYYIEWYQENAANDITDTDVKAYYEKNRDTLDIASIRYFPIMYKDEASESSTATYTKKEAKARAEEFISKITDEESFKGLAIEYAEKEYKDSYKEDNSTLAENLTKQGLSQLSEDFGKWTFDSARKYGDVAFFDVESQHAYYIAYMVATPDKDKSVASADVRHLLVQAATTDSNGKALSESQKNKNFAEAKKEAEALLEEWKSGKATEDSFAELVTKHTDDAGSKATGGLYEGIANDGKYVQEFTDWALQDHKPGDTGIVKTTYGYHIMYYVTNDGLEKWEKDTRAAIANEKYNDYFDGVYNDISENVERTHEKVIDYFAGKNLEQIEDIIDRSSAYSYY